MTICDEYILNSPSQLASIFMRHIMQYVLIHCLPKSSQRRLTLSMLNLFGSGFILNKFWLQQASFCYYIFLANTFFHDEAPSHAYLEQFQTSVSSCLQFQFFSCIACGIEIMYFNIESLMKPKIKISQHKNTCFLTLPLLQKTSSAPTQNKTKSINQTINQSIDQSLSQHTTQSSNHVLNYSINQSMEAINPPVDISIIFTFNQSFILSCFFLFKAILTTLLTSFYNSCSTHLKQV